MSVTIKTEEEINILREGGRILAGILNRVASAARQDVLADDLDKMAFRLIAEAGASPSFLGYRTENSSKPFPSSLCVSINDEVVHGISNSISKKIFDGDIVGLDLGIKYKGLFTDMAVTVPIGRVDKVGLRLIEMTKAALEVGINAATPGRRVEVIGKAITEFVKPSGFSIVEVLSGHGVGYKVHEDPHVPNYVSGSRGPVLKAGMVLAIEPMLNEGNKDVVLSSDSFTYKTKDGKRSAHFEHTIVITPSGPEVITASV